MGGESAAAPRSSACRAIPATVGCSKTAFTGSSTPSLVRSRVTTRVARRE